MIQTSGSSTHSRSTLRRLFYNREVRQVFFQIVTVLGVCALGIWIGTNMVNNLEAVGKELSFDFLVAPAGYDIDFQPFLSYSPVDTHLRAALVGLTNTLLIAITGIIFSTILGFTLGVMRLSKNFLISKLSQGLHQLHQKRPGPSSHPLHLRRRHQRAPNAAKRRRYRGHFLPDQSRAVHARSRA